MRMPWLCSFVLLCATTVLAQTPAPSAPQSASTPSPAVSITGCVAGGSDSKPITLTNAMVLPTGSAAVPQEPAAAVPPASASPSPDRPAVSGATTQPNPAAPATPASPTAGTATNLGTIDTGSATVGVGTSGTIATPPAPTGTAGVPAAGAAISGTAPAGSSASSIGGYRLSGVDMTSWIGRRVQLTGVVVPSTTGEPAAAVDASEPAAAAKMAEFKVITVQPVTGPCPK
jgi:hypothetical protein